ncbi:MAG: hypothetical protein ACLU38_00745 [Dysosmobacter sp.]
MIETTVKVDGMMCGMCEAHVSACHPGALPVKKSPPPPTPRGRR